MKETLRAVASVAPPPARVLDLAAAQGTFSLRLAEDGYSVTWNDLREDLVGYVRLKHEFGAIEYLPGNIFELEPTSDFDVVLITEVIEHVAHPDEFLCRVASLVRPGGRIVLTTPNGAYFRNKLPRFSDHPDPSIFESVQFKPDADGHIFLLHEDEIRQLAASAGLTTENLLFFSNPLTAGHLKLNRLLRVVPRRWVDVAESASNRLPSRTLSSRVHVHLLAVLRRDD